MSILFTSLIAGSSRRIIVNDVRVRLKPGVKSYVLKADEKTTAKVSTLFMRTGFHGTTTKSMGDQLEKGVFENRKDQNKVYMADKRTAIDYAITRAERDGSTPIVLKVASSGKEEYNPIELEGWGFGLGHYAFFRPDNAPVHIKHAYHVEEHQ